MAGVADDEAEAAPVAGSASRTEAESAASSEGVKLGRSVGGCMGVDELMTVCVYMYMYVCEMNVKWKQTTCRTDSFGLGVASL